MFPSQRGSNYFRVGRISGTEYPSISINAVTNAQRQARKAQQNIEAWRRQAIEKREVGTEYSL